MKVMKKNNPVKLSELNSDNVFSVGDEFGLAGINWKIVDITDIGYMCVGDLMGLAAFGAESNDWRKSPLRHYLNTGFREKIAEEIGENNIIQFERDLLSINGYEKYGKIKDFVSLLTIDEYRKYKKYISNTEDAWWLITPWNLYSSTYIKNLVATISTDGDVGYIYCSHLYGVRPVCILSASVFTVGE